MALEVSQSHLKEEKRKSTTGGPDNGKHVWKGKVVKSRYLIFHKNLIIGVIVIKIVKLVQKSKYDTKC